MFPAGSILSEETCNVVCEEPIVDDWLKSCTYTKEVLKPDINSSSSDLIGQSNQSKRRSFQYAKLKVPVKKSVISHRTVFLQDVPGLKINDAYRLDRSCNREIYRHGCIYERHVSRYRQPIKIPVLGFPSLRLCELSDLTEAKQRKGVKRSRYFSKYSRSLLLQPSIPLFSDACTTDSLPSVITLRDVPKMVPPKSPELLNDSILALCEQLNRRVYDAPNDLKSWLELIEIQAKDARFVYLPGKSDDSLSDSDRLLIIQKQLSIAERALSGNPGSLNLKLITLRLNELSGELVSRGANNSCSNVLPSSLLTSDQVGREWAQLVFTYPQVVSTWRGYIAHLMGKFATPPPLAQSVGTGLFARIDAVYKRALGTLSGIISGRILSHRPQSDTAERAIDLLADYCHWLVQAGHSERALAIWQAVVEFNCFRPSELVDASSDHCNLEMELYWSSGCARFGQPGCEHWQAWYRTHRLNVPKRHVSSKGSTKVATVKRSSTPKGCDIVQEFDPQADAEEMRTKWSQLSQDLKDVSNRCEDALIQISLVDSVPDELNSKADSDVLPSVLSSSSAVSDEHWVRTSASVPSLTGRASLSRSRVIQYRRGRAWVCLERTREAIGWLPSDTLRLHKNSTPGKPMEEVDTFEEDEDPERLVLFDDVKPCLLELVNLAFDKTNAIEIERDRRSQRSISLQQRLIILCLEFLGAYQPEVAAAHGLPSDLRLAHDLTNFGPVQRQNLCPPLASSQDSIIPSVFDTALFGDPKPSRLRPAAHQDVCLHAKRCFLDSALLQASQVHSWPLTVRTRWLTVLGHLRFQLVLDRLLNGIVSCQLSPKCVSSIWRYCGRSIMALGENQQQLDLWRTYASGLWRAAHLMSAKQPSSDIDPFITMIVEARRIFDTALVSYPLPSASENDPENQTELVNFYLNVWSPRLRLLQRYIDLELGFSPGPGGSRSLRLVNESKALHLLVYAALGGEVPDSATGDVRPSPSSLVRASHAYGKRMEMVWHQVTSLAESAESVSDLLTSLAVTFPLLAYFSFMFDLLTSDQVNSCDFLDGLLAVLARIDRLRSLADSPCKTNRVTTRFSDGDALPPSKQQHTNLSDSILPSRGASRYFLILAVAGVTAFSALRQRNRAPLMDTLMRSYLKHCSDAKNSEYTRIPPVLLFPSQTAYLLPSRVALDHHYLPLSLSNAFSCQGLLPPVILTRLTQQLHQFCTSVAMVAADRLTCRTVAPRIGADSSWHRRLPAVFEMVGEEVATGAVNLLQQHGVGSSSQLDLLASSLPLAVDLVLLALELERWTSLLTLNNQSELRKDTPLQRRNPACDQRVRSAFERAVQCAAFLSPLLAPTPTVGPKHLLLHVVLASVTPSLWASHLRVVVWRAYMAFGWMSADPGDPRQRRQAVKSVFYRAVEDVPWAKVLYTDLVRYCPEDVEEVVDLLSERELRLRTPLEEVDLLLNTKPSTSATC